jgi:Flp pilus assembly protein TadB
MNYEQIILFSTFMTVVFVLAGVKITINNRKSEMKKFLEDNYDLEENEKSIKERYLEWVARYLGSKSKFEKVERMLLQADVEKVNAEDMLGIAFGSAATIGVLFFIIFFPDYQAGLFFGFVIGLLVYKIPYVFLEKKAARRSKRGNSEVLNFSEMLSTAIDAGLSLDQALNKICQYAEGVLVEEFNKAIGEMNGGENKKNAFSNIISRFSLNEAADVVLFIEAIIQSDESGQPINKVLYEQGERIRNSKQNKANELAQKANGKLVFPIMVYILVPMMYLVIGPAMVKFGSIIAY